MIVSKLETLRDLIHEHVRIAQEKFQEGADVPLIIGYAGTGRLVFPLGFSTTQEKMQCLEMVKLGFVGFDVKRYTFDMQGYTLKLHNDVFEQEMRKLNSSGMSIKDHPDHIEILMCGAISRKERLASIFEIVNTGNGRKLELLESDKGDVVGHFAELLPQGETNESLKREIREHFIKKGFRMV